MNTESARENKPRYRPYGQALLLALVIALLAGTFSLSRISPDLDWVDIRLVACYVLVLGFTVWALGAHGHWPQHRPITSSIWWFYAWVAWMALSATWAPNGARIKDSLVGLLAMTIYVSMAAQIVKRLEIEDPHVIWTALLIIAMLYFGAAMVVGPGDQGRYSAFGGGPNVFVRVVLIGAISALFLYLRTGRIITLLTIPFLSVGAVLSGSRGGLVAGATVLMIGIIPIFRRLGVKRSVWTGALMALGLWGILIFGGTATMAFLQQRFIQQTLVQGYSSGRVSISEEVIGLFQEHIWFGVGLDGFYGLMGQNSGDEYPHNLFLASAAEGGLVGVTLVTIAVIALIKAALKRRPMSAHTLFAWLAGILLLVASQFSGDYYDSRMMWFFFVLAAVDARPARKPPRPTAKTAAPTSG